MKLVLFAALATFEGTAVHASSTIARSVIGSGGGTVSSAHQLVTATIGQTLVGRVDAPSHVLRGGFWLGHTELTVDVDDPARGPRPPGAASVFVLHANTPNPFRSVTVIRYDVPRDHERVQLQIHDVSGRRIRTIVDRQETVGPKQVIWDGLDDRGLRTPAGVYLCTLRAGERRYSHTLTLVR